MARPRIKLDLNHLYDLHWRCGMTVEEMSKVVYVSPTTIRLRMDEAGVPRRGRRTAALERRK